jgi:spatacsin
LNTTFVKVLNENEWTLLKAILYSNGPKKFELARQFAKVYDLNQAKLCDFMLKEVLANLYSYCEMTKIGFPAHNVQLMLNPTNNDEFSSLIKIFKPNSNLFGLSLYEKSRCLLVEAKSTDDYVILTELLIQSYNFFSQLSSMEGISNVLRTCKLCAHQLEKAGEFNIMIRLLTGIGHYNEMTYIMDFLWNNSQFEMLFGKGIGKVMELFLNKVLFLF